MIDRLKIESDERRRLAPYAALSSESRGRVYPQEEHHLRTAFQRDRDRIVHATAFRRLDFKTQVFLPHEGDHFRTRLTHTIEVAQIARSIARNLGLNEDLAEPIALAHDLGHTPFGHSGEDILDELLADCGGFNHNRQSLRIVDFLEQRYAHHPGLNLSYEVREGLAKHATRVEMTHPDFDKAERSTLEATVADLADEIAYNAHDIDDGLRSGLITLGDLRPLGIFSKAGTANPIGSIDVSRDSGDYLRHFLSRWLINLLAENLIGETDKRIERLRIDSLESARLSNEPICTFSAEMKSSVMELKAFLLQNLYHHPRLLDKQRHVRRVVEKLFCRFEKEPEKMPQRFQQMLDSEEKKIVIADYIAGMTDRYAEETLANG